MTHYDAELQDPGASELLVLDGSNFTEIMGYERMGRTTLTTAKDRNSYVYTLRDHPLGSTQKGCHESASLSTAMHAASLVTVARTDVCALLEDQQGYTRHAM